MYSGLVLFVAVLAGVLIGWFAHKFYLRWFIYNPLRLHRYGYPRRYAARMRTSKALRKINRRKSLIRTAERTSELADLFAGRSDF